MKNINILTCLLFTVVFSNQLYSQDKDSSIYTNRFQLKVEVGLNMPLTNMNQNKITDYFVEYSSESKFVPSLSAIWFIRKRFGIEADLKFVYFNDGRNTGNNFQKFANEEFGENYYVKASSPIDNNFIPVISFGMVYRIETEHLYFYPKFSIGITSFYSNWGGIDLKEKNTNNEYKISYSQEKIAKDNLTLTPAVTMGYKLSDRFWVDLNLKTSFFRSNFTYETTRTDLYTKQVQQLEKTPYKENMAEVYFSVGVTYVLARKNY